MIHFEEEIEEDQKEEKIEIAKGGICLQFTPTNARSVFIHSEGGNN
jgi:hypothetical protein